MYAITFEISHNRIDVTLSGMLGVEEVGRYIADLRSGFLKHRFRAGYRLLIDTTGCTIQPQAVMEALQHHMASFPKAGAIAMIVGSSLARMQVRRVMRQPYCRIVETRDDGLAWLTADAVVPQPGMAAAPG